MQIFNLTETNCTPLSTHYNLDSTVSFKKHTLFTENNIFFNLENVFKDPNDFTTNNYSNLYLTSKKFINDIIQINSLNYIDDTGFSTSLAANSLFAINENSKYWVCEEPEYYTNIAQVAVSGLQADFDNRYYFELVFIDNFTCKIYHENDGVKRVLTLDTTANLSFCKEDTDLDYLGEYSPQIFLYIYDRAQDLILFFKNVNDIIYYVTFNSVTSDLILSEVLSGTSLDFTNRTVFRCEPRNDSTNLTYLDDPYLAYQKIPNSLEVDESLSFENTQANFLLNTEYQNITSGDKLDVNVLSLKNTNTAENYQSRGNPIYYDSNVVNRDYKKLFTGSNQELGNDNITVGYETYTSNVIFKKDKVTYFHVPQNIYPLHQLNINDSKLAESGAIAGDHPMKSDKIFKKKADYKYTSYFGNTKLENIGTFLCSWLSGNQDINTRPIWMDRYYFPSKVSFLGALSSNDFNAIEYRSFYDCIAGDLTPDIHVYDKRSDSIFEPGTYYAYHHLGEKYSSDFINYLKDNLIQKVFYTYKTTPPNSFNISQDFNNPEYIFNGNNYTLSENLSSIDDSNQFTLIADIYNEDWQSPFGYQILGNYVNDGFGVFNCNEITPELGFIYSNDSIGTNINFDIIRKFENISFSPSNSGVVIKTEGFSDFFVLDQTPTDATFARYDIRSSIIYFITDSRLKNFYDYDYDSENVYVLGRDSATSDGRLFKISMVDGKIDEIFDTTTAYNLYFLQFPLDSIKDARTINFKPKNTSFYFTSGTKAERDDDIIYFQTFNNSTNAFEINKWNTKFNSTSADSYFVLISAYNSIEDYDIDLDENVHLLYDKNRYAVFDKNNQLIHKTILPHLSSVARSTIVDFAFFLSDDNSGLKKYTLICASSANGNNIVYKIDDQNNIIQTFTPPYKGFVRNSITNSSFLRNYKSDLFLGEYFNIKLKLKNFINLNETISYNWFYSLSSLTPGYHNFVFRFDSDYGTFHMLVDGKIEIEEYFTPDKYIFSNLFTRPFFFGTGPYFNTVPIFDYLKLDTLNAKDIKMKNVYIYNKALNYFDIMFHNKANSQISDIVFDLPSGRRNYLEEIERYFKYKTPGHKSPQLNVVLKNTGINDNVLRKEIESRIYSLLDKSLPAYTKVNTVKWS
jgi:hypothetical protein